MLLQCKCGQKLQVKDQGAGTMFRCPACKQVFSAPAQPAPREEVKQEDAPPWKSLDLPAPRKDRRGTSPSLVKRHALALAIGGGVALVVVVSLVLILARGGGTPSKTRPDAERAQTPAETGRQPGTRPGPTQAASGPGPTTQPVSLPETQEPWKAFAGTWVAVYFHNYIRVYTVTADGKVTWEQAKETFPLAKQGEDTVLVLTGKQQTERWRLEDGKLKIDHFGPQAKFPDGKPSVSAVAEKKSAAQLEEDAKALRRFKGSWYVEYSNKSSVQWSFDAKGKMTDGGWLLRVKGRVLFDRGEGKLDRLTLDGDALLVEHYPQNSSYLANPDKPGITGKGIRYPRYPAPISDEVIAGWKKAGRIEAVVQVGWMRPDVDGTFQSVPSEGDVPAFQFLEWKKGMLMGLPEPETGFGISLSGMYATDAVVKELLQFKKLKRLNLSSNRLTDAGLKELTKLPQLELLILDNNPIGDAGLAALAELKNLSSLDLSHTRVTSEGIKTLARVPRLRKLQLDQGTVTDAALKELGKLTQLQELCLTHSKVSLAGIKELSRLTNLEKLTLFDIPVTDAGLKELAGLQELTSLSLGDVGITDSGMKDVAKLTQLEHLSLGHNPLTDAALREVGKLTELQSLVLDGLPITDAGLKELTRLKELQHLQLADTKVTAEGVKQLRQALSRVSVYAPQLP